MNQKSSSKRTPNKGRSRKKYVEYKDRTNSTKAEVKDCANDPSWYIREGQLASDVASLSFNNALGAPTKLDNINGANFSKVDLQIPGIMAIHTVPAPGISKSAVSPINIAAKNLYSFVRHANSGHSNYDSPDLMLYLMAMDSVYNWIYHLQRAYGVAQIFSQRNRYIGDALLQAMGFIPNALRNNLAQFRASINMLIVKASVFAVPTTMTLFKRHAWMYSSIFADSPVEKCQMYMYLPSVLHEYVETDGAGYLKAVETLVKKANGAANNYMVEVTPYTDSLAIGIAEEMLGALQASEDINIMSGDIMKAYGQENLFRLGLVPETYSVLPMYSEEILDQIHNTVFMGAYPRLASMTPTVDTVTNYNIHAFDITQDPSIGAGNLLFQPACINNPIFGYDNIIDMAENQPSPERVLVATRNVATGYTSLLDFEGTKYWYSMLSSVGSDICLYATYYYTDPSNGNLTAGGAYKATNAVATSAISKLDKFHKAPLVYSGTVTNDVFTPNSPYGSIEDFTIVNDDVISKMHQSAILSMLGVPV